MADPEEQSEERRSAGTDGSRPEGSRGEDQRDDGVMLDLERLEEQMDALYLHRFVEYVKKVRGEHGRYLTLRAGDELAIKAANDGSAEKLQEIIAEDLPE